MRVSSCCGVLAKWFWQSNAFQKTWMPAFAGMTGGGMLVSASMKLRIYESSLRFRLTQEEAEELHLGRIVESKVQFSRDLVLRFAIEPCQDEMSAKLLNNEIVVYVSVAGCERLAREEQGVNFAVNDGQLRIIVEKDLDCRH
jgi:hypothetical protein